MKNLVFLSLLLLMMGCNNASNDKAPAHDTVITQPAPASEPAAVMFKVTDEEALHMVSQVDEINKELKRTFEDKTVRNQLVLVQPASPEDANHYIQLMEMHDDRGVTLAHFRVDAMSGEIRVMDPLSEGETWVTLEQWRQIKL